MVQVDMLFQVVSQGVEGLLDTQIIGGVMGATAAKPRQKCMAEMIGGENAV